MHDSDRVNLFYKEGFEKRTTDAQYSYLCAKQAEYFSQKISLPYYTSKANNLLGILYYRKGDLKKALSYHKIALNLRTITNDQKGIALSETNLGNIYTDLHEYKLAEMAYLKAIEINNLLGNQKQTANGLLNLGVLKVEEHNLPLAIDYFKKANDLAKKINDYEIEAMCLNNMADVNILLKNYDEAIANAENSIKLKSIMDNEMEMADSYINIANAFMQKNEPEPALENLTIADSIITKYDYIIAKIPSLIIKYTYFEKIKNYELAFKYLKEKNILKDSLDKLNKDYDLENNFEETLFKAGITDNTGAKNGFKMYMFFGLFFFIALILLLFVFKFKR